MRYFPLEQIHIVDGDKFIKEPWTQLEKLEKFLELPQEITEENFFFNATKESNQIWFSMCISKCDLGFLLWKGEINITSESVGMFKVIWQKN